MEGKSIFDDGEGVFGGKGGYGGVGEDEDGEGVATVDFAVEFRLDEVVVEKGVFWEV